jgi:hypothetical protein
MCLKLRCILGMVLGLLGLLTPLVFAAEQAPKPFPPAQLVAVEGEAHTYRVIDRGGRVITTTVPAQSITNIRTNRPDGLVHDTIIAIDMATNQVKAKTEAGQVLVLAVPHDALAGLQLGNTFALALPQHAAVAARR